MLKKVATEKAPAAIGPYSQAIIVDKMVFTSGQIPLDPATGVVVGEEIKERCIIVNAVSKAYAMTGWRCGYVACRRKEPRSAYVRGDFLPS